jgi:ribosomal protein L11 methyltransferase
MTREYVEVHVTTAVDSGELLAWLDEPACLGACEREGGISLFWSKEGWHEASREALRQALRMLGDVTAGETLRVEDLPNKDWNATWAASLQPICLGRRILIRQSWNSAPAPPGGFELVIDPKRAFGTGYHATTQLIAAWLEEAIHGGERVLDIGTGSGILAMISIRLGARSALAIDNDPEAIECAREYALANGFGEEMDLRVAALEDLAPETFDLLVANLDRKTLLRYFAVFHPFVRPDGRLLVSGLLREDREEIFAALMATGWEVGGLRESVEWMALELLAVARA